MANIDSYIPIDDEHDQHDYVDYDVGLQLLVVHDARQQRHDGHMFVEPLLIGQVLSYQALMRMYIEHEHENDSHM